VPRLGEEQSALDAHSERGAENRQEGGRLRRRRVDMAPVAPFDPPSDAEQDGGKQREARPVEAEQPRQKRERQRAAVTAIRALRNVEADILSCLAPWLSDGQGYERQSAPQAVEAIG
jgi:hypothetical protein